MTLHVAATMKMAARRTAIIIIDIESLELPPHAGRFDFGAGVSAGELLFARFRYDIMRAAMKLSFLDATQPERPPSLSPMALPADFGALHDNASSARSAAADFGVPQDAAAHIGTGGQASSLLISATMPCSGHRAVELALTS